MLRNANEAIENRDWRAAELAVREGLAVDPGNPLLLNCLALCRKQAGDSIGVLTALRRACDSDRGAFSLHCQLATLEHRLSFIDRITAVIARLRTMAATDDERAKATQLEKIVVGASFTGRRPNTKLTFPGLTSPRSGICQ
jgi:hypothetical protein